MRSKIIIGLLALGILLSFVLTKRLVTKEKMAREHVQIYQKSIAPTAIEILQNESLDSRISTLNIEEKFYTPNPVIFKQAYQAIYKKDLTEIIHFADQYPKEPLLQYLTIVNCRWKKINGCESERFAKRLVEIDPNDAVGKSLLATHYMNKNKLSLALSQLDTINTNDSHKTYFAEIAHGLVPVLREQDEHKSRTLDELYIAGVGISAAQGIDTSMFKYCIDQIKSDTGNEHWIKSCKTYGDAMLNSKSILDQSLGLALNKEYFKVKNLMSDYDAISKKKDNMDKVMHVYGALSSEDGFYTEENSLSSYFEEFARIGEYRTMYNYLQNNKKQILEKYK